MRRRNEPVWARLAGATALSSALVFGALWWVAHAITLPSDQPAPSMRAPARQSVVLLTEDEVRAMMARKAPPPPKKKDAPKEKKEEKKEEKKLERPTGQVVEIPPPKREEVPENSNLVSEYNSKVEKQTVSRTDKPPSPEVVKGPEVKRSPGDDPTGNTRERQKQASKQKRKRRKGPKRKTDGVARQKPSEKIGQRDKKTPEKSRRWTEEVPGPSGLTPDVEGTLQAKQEKRDAGEQGGAGPLASAGGPEDYKALLPNMGPEEMARSDGSIDHVEDVDDGPQTLLNTREYKYAWFFNRVKNQVSQHWRPGGAYRRRDPYGRVYGRKDRVTILQITLNPKGGLEDVYVKRDSGVTFLDEVAIQAVRRAQPFPNPPVGLQDADGLITFKFEFYLELNRPGLRFLH